MGYLPLIAALLLYLSCLNAQMVTIHGARKFSVASDSLVLQPAGKTEEMFIDFVEPYVTKSGAAAFPANMYEGTLFERPTRAVWFNRSEGDLAATPATFGLASSAASIHSGDTQIFLSVLPNEDREGNVIDPFRHRRGFRGPDLDFIFAFSHAPTKSLTVRYRVTAHASADEQVRVQLGKSEGLKFELGIVECGRSLQHISSYKRTVLRDGFHRSVETNMTIVTDRPLSGCTLHAVEPVLEQHFVETDLLDDIPGCKHWISAPSDIELPSSLASQYLLRFDMPARSGRVYSRFYTFENRSSTSYNVIYAFPYHFRYLSVGRAPFESVEVLNPVLYLSCPGDSNKGDLADPLDALLRESVVGSPAAARLSYVAETWRGKVPIAQHKDKSTVVVVTALATLLSMICIVTIAIKKAGSAVKS